MTGNFLNDFVNGYNQLNARQFADLSYKEIQKLMAEYEAIDPMISQVIYDAYIMVATCHNSHTTRDLVD